jgi:uncharacterized damage-inducible protein DinB
MSVDMFRHYFGYHFAENRALWDDHIVKLTTSAFTQPGRYSRGSIQKQLLHLIEVDEVWFCGLRGAEFPPELDPAKYTSYDAIRTYWDAVEASMKTYLNSLNPYILDSTPLENEDANLRVWQVLFQVINHGTDHRAQILRSLNDLGQKTTSQDYIFYAYNHSPKP